jgi:predicted transcriptional regulator
MHQLELEGIAESVLREGKQDDERAPRLAALVNTLLGEGSVEYASNMIGDGALVRFNDEWHIFIKRRLPIKRRSFAVAHELAEWWLRVKERYNGSDVETCANYIAAAIMSPRRAFRRAVRQHGHDFGQLAAAFRTTETHVALREAELDEMPRVVVAPSRVRTRGPEAWVWPEEATLRRWASRPAPGLRKVRLGDDPRRVVLDVDVA